MLICVFTGFASGLPLYFLLNLVPAWLRTEGVDLKAIGLFALIQLPYTWKFVWSPVLDRFRLPWLGRRRGWMAATQLALVATLAGFALFNPALDLPQIAALAACVAFCSASHLAWSRVGPQPAMTLKPSLCRRWQMAVPMPPIPPVTYATFWLIKTLSCYLIVFS